MAAKLTGDITQGGAQPVLTEEEKALNLAKILNQTLGVPSTAIPQGPATAGIAGGGGAVLAAPATELPEQDPTLFGMSGNQLATIAGGIGAALAPPETWQARLGKFAQNLGKAKIIADAPDVDRTLTPIVPATDTTKKKKPVDNITGKVDTSRPLI